MHRPNQRASVSRELIRRLEERENMGSFKQNCQTQDSPYYIQLPISTELNLSCAPEKAHNLGYAKVQSSTNTDLLKTELNVREGRPGF